jgi:hypothetical protein
MRERRANFPRKLASLYRSVDERNIESLFIPERLFRVAIAII